MIVLCAAKSSPFGNGRHQGRETRCFGRSAGGGDDACCNLSSSSRSGAGERRHAVCHHRTLQTGRRPLQARGDHRGVFAAPPLPSGRRAESSQIISLQSCQQYAGRLLMTFACSSNCRRPLTRLQFGWPALSRCSGVGRRVSECQRVSEGVSECRCRQGAAECAGHGCRDHRGLPLSRDSESETALSCPALPWAAVIFPLHTYLQLFRSYFSLFIYVCLFC